MAFGLGTLRLSPEAFWSLTPRELAALLSGSRQPTVAPGRAGLERLMHDHPDHQGHRSSP
jgi:uncharacterized phage protein (TIGR02216 family)